jgi:DNA polymerase-3 subunit epsilon
MALRLPGRRQRGGTAVPGWAMLDRPWREAELCVVDLETTGLDLRRDEVVAYGAVIVRDGRVVVREAVEGLVRPSAAASTGAVTIHGLLPERLTHAPSPPEAAAALVEALAGRVLVAHAAWVETAFLRRLLALAGARLDGPVLDTAALARAAAVAPGGPAEPALDGLAERLGLPVHPRHDALGDALTTAAVLLALATRLDRREPQTVRSLAALSRSHVRG